MPAARAGPPPAHRRQARRPAAPAGGAARARTAAARRTAAADEHQEVDAVADLPGRRRRLIHHRLEAEQVEIHLHGGRIARGDREVARVLERDDPLLRRRLGHRADVAERAAAAAVADVVQLKDDAARIGDEQIARAAVGRSAFVLPPRAHECLLRSGFLRISRRRGEAVRRERLHRAFDREVLDAEPERADARPLARCRLPQRDEPRSVADPQQHGRSLPRLHRHAEQPLIEVERPRDVGDGQRDLAEAVDAERRRAGLGQQPGAMASAGSAARKWRRSMDAGMPGF